MTVNSVNDVVLYKTKKKHLKIVIVTVNATTGGTDTFQRLQLFTRLLNVYILK